MQPHEPQRILMATDFSDCSQPALDYAVLLARRFQASVHLLYVAQPPTFVAPDALNVIGQILETELAAGRKRMEVALAALGRAGIADFGGEVVMGYAADQICERANAGRYDLVVLGTHGRGGFKHLLVGSVAEHVVRRSLIPVVTVRPPPHQP